MLTWINAESDVGLSQARLCENVGCLTLVGAAMGPGSRSYARIASIVECASFIL
jgi:hypothetical protein